MIIQPEQSEAFRQQMAKGFEERMVAHLRASLPRETGALDDHALRTDIRAGTLRAAQYGIQNERDVARFIDLMFRVRRDFDTNPETAWARPILMDKSSRADNRIRRLQAKAQQVLAARSASRGARRSGVG